MDPLNGGRAAAETVSNDDGDEEVDGPLDALLGWGLWLQRE